MYSICVPSTCTSEDIIGILNNSTNDTLSKVPITLNQEDCRTKNMFRKLRLIDWIATYVKLDLIFTEKLKFSNVIAE